MEIDGKKTENRTFAVKHSWFWSFFNFYYIVPKRMKLEKIQIVDDRIKIFLQNGLQKEITKGEFQARCTVDSYNRKLFTIQPKDGSKFRFLSIDAHFKEEEWNEILSIFQTYEKKGFAANRHRYSP